MDEQPPTRPRVIAVVGVGAAPTVEVADALAAALGPRDRVLVSRKLTASGLHRAEADHDQVVLVAATVDDDRWRDFCLRQADRLVVVAPSGAPAPSAPPAAPNADAYVVLVGAPPSRETAISWHDALSPRFVTTADPDTLGADVAPVGARLAGRSIGVALAGGGARAFAAIGVLEELVAAGMRIDRISGCSVGSVIAALFATGRDPAAVDAACYEEFVRRNPANDYRMPSVAITAGRKAEAAIRRHLGETTFEELPRELALVSTDLLRRRLVVHRRGAVATAVRASLSLPGLYPPARIGDSLHVDGGVLDNLPVRALSDRDEGPIIAVNIAAASSMSTRSGPPRMPSLGETLLRTMLMAGTSTIDDARRQAAIVVTPDTRGIGLLEFHQIDRAREAGRAAGRAVVEALHPGPTSVTLPVQRHIDLREGAQTPT